MDPVKVKHKIADSHLHTRFINLNDTHKMLEDIESVGVTNACILALPYRSCAENLFALFIKNTYKAMEVRAFGGLHITDRYSAISPIEQVKALIRLGCDGIKLMFSPDVERYIAKGLDNEYFDEMFSFLEENDIPVNIHLADPEKMWLDGGQYADPSFPTKEEMYQEAFRMLDKHPRLRVCFAHFMFLSDFRDRAEWVLESYPNVLFDLTPGVEMYYNFDKDIPAWKAFFEKYKDRIIFGTDGNIVKTCNKELELLVYRKLTEKGGYSEFLYGRDIAVSGLDLSENAVKRICYDNYFSFLGDTPKPVNKEMLIECAKRIIADLESNPHDEYYIRGGELIPDLKKDSEQRIAYNFCKTAIEKLQ